MATNTQATFPNFKPTQRQFTDGEYPVKTFTSMAGVEYRRIYGGTPANYKLQLQYTLPDASALQFRSHYHNRRGTYRSFYLDAASLVWSGLSSTSATDLNTQPNNTTPIAWRYEGPPQITPLPGAGQYSQVTVNLTGVIVNTFNPVV